MGAAETIFESIKNEDTLQQWVDEERPEDLHLELGAIMQAEEEAAAQA